MDAHGNESTFIEKVPVVTLADLDANSSYPQTGYIACQVVERRIGTNGVEVVTISTQRAKCGHCSRSTANRWRGGMGRRRGSGTLVILLRRLVLGKLGLPPL